jgi:soluble lytic murein transglycosylase-like protein
MQSTSTCESAVLKELGRWVFVALCATPAAQAQIYAGRTQDGGIVLSNFRSAAADELAVAAPPEPAPPRIAGPLPQAAGGQAAAQGSGRFAALIHRIGREADVSPQLLHAVIAVESGFDARAVSHKGALGLMQLMPQTAQRFGVVDPFDPAQNIAGGAAYLKWLLGLFGGDVELALAAYNAGEAAVIRAGYRIPPYPETRAYVPRVLARLNRPTLY